MEKFLSFVTIDKWELIFTWVNLFILYLLMKKFLFKPVRKVITDREKEIKEMYDNAEKAEKNAESMKAEYDNKLKGAETESQEIIKTAVRTAHEKEAQILDDARGTAARTVKRAEEEIALEKKKALDDVKDEISAMAVEIASKVIEKDINESDHHELINGFIDKL